ncbi:MULTISPECIES: hypothetical protein [unclassified Leucobacter]|uniref:hypothetical protein n=1 Tax=unclassified Leucobacter TaxID=2621730 RepID=UPI00165E9E5E|nr:MULTISPECIES: hypothetical protein [unclassified Leucobacter]MBC9927964.1 hypothetical protein [Leucobacter sp. cx-169]
MTNIEPAGPDNPPQQPQPVYQPSSSSAPPVPGLAVGAPVAKGLAIAALVVGIVAFLSGLVPIWGIIVGVVGVALGVIALVKGQPKGLALTGTILAGVAVVASIIATIIAGAFTAAVVDTVEKQTSVTSEIPGEDAAATDEDPPASEKGTRENPLPLGAIISSDDWDVVVNSVNLSANDAVASANPYNEAAPEGQQYALVNVSVTYKGADTGMPAFVQIDYVTATGEVISTWDSFAIAPEPTFGAGELYAGGQATGNLAFLIPSSADGILRITPGIFADDVFVATK